MRVFSNRCTYALRVSLYVASFVRSGEFIPIRQVAKSLRLSFPFLSKIFCDLSKAQIIKTRRGRYGGVALVRDPERISLLEIVEAIDGRIIITGCVLNRLECVNKSSCPLHDKWENDETVLRNVLSSTTLKALKEPIRRNKICLSDPIRTKRAISRVTKMASEQCSHTRAMIAR